MISTFFRPLHGQPAPLQHCQSPTQLPIATATPFALPPCHASPPPLDRSPARRLAPRAPRTQDQNTETRRLGLLPPWYIYRPQTGFIILTSIQWIVNPGGHLEALPGPHNPGKDKSGPGRSVITPWEACHAFLGVIYKEVTAKGVSTTRLRTCGLGPSRKLHASCWPPQKSMLS